jgi:hypothetical protein
LEKNINKDIGLKLDILSLSPILKIGITVEYFNLDGKEPNSRDLLKMYVNGELIKVALHLRILIEISLYPCAFFVFNDFLIFSISSVDVHLNLILGYKYLQF